MPPPDGFGSQKCRSRCPVARGQRLHGCSLAGELLIVSAIGAALQRVVSGGAL